VGNGYFPKEERFFDPVRRQKERYPGPTDYETANKGFGFH
jgi:hypothetical protein